jgi:GAF domain-containing protein
MAQPVLDQSLAEWRRDDAVARRIGGCVELPETLERRADEQRARVAEAARTCATLLGTEGPAAALCYLNGRTRFRFTGFYRAEPPLLLNVHLFDRENPTLNLSGDVCRLEDTYCARVWGDERPFVVLDSLGDPRVVAHASRERVQSYCGVPIWLDGGRLWGTLCHYDVRPRLLPHAELEVLERVATLLAAHVVRMAPTI